MAAPAKAGVIAPLDVTVPAQNTSLGPEKTSFFQALAIQTKISKGTIEILVCCLHFLFCQFAKIVANFKVFLRCFCAGLCRCLLIIFHLE